MAFTLSDVFGPTENATSVGGSTQQNIVAAFEDFVRANIPKAALPAVCISTATATPSTTRSRMKNPMAKNGGRFIETGWRYQSPP
jgi:hypothetical protein